MVGKRTEIFELKAKLDFLQANSIAQRVGGYGAAKQDFHAKVGVRYETLRDSCDPTKGIVGLGKAHQEKISGCCKFELDWVEWIDPKAGVAGHERQDTAEAFRARYLKEHEQESERIGHPEEAADASRTNDAAESRIAAELADIIRKTPEVLNRLKQQRGLEALPAVKSPSDDRAVDSAVRYLLNADMDVVIKACHRAFVSISKGRFNKTADQIEDALIQLAQRLVPALYQGDDVAKIKSALGRDASGLVVLSIHWPAVAEVAVSAAEGDSASFLPRQDDDAWPVGARSFIDQAPDSGYDAQKERLNDLKRQLAEPFSTSNAERVYDSFRLFMAGSSYFQPASGTDFPEEFRFEMACDHIKFLMDEAERRFYMTFPLPKTEHERKVLRKLVANLEENLQGMLFLALDQTEATVRAETKRFRPFVRMFPLQTEGKPA